MSIRAEITPPPSDHGSSRREKVHPPGQAKNGSQSLLKPAATRPGAPPAHAAWLESSRGENLPLGATCSFGRLGSNHIALDDDKASRRHAAIERQGRNAYWLIDMASRNGTYLNGRRLTKVTRLFDQDRIKIGESQFTFRQPASQRNQPNDHTHTHTVTATNIQASRTRHCWLLVVDLESSTEFTRRLPPEKLPSMMGRFLDQCRDIIEQYGGSIDKYLGDGMFAFWLDEEKVDEKVASTLAELKTFQERSNPPFRIALHYAEVTISGIASWVQESLMGPEVNFTFRMERLGSLLGVSRLVSQPAQKALATHFKLTEIGSHSVSGFEKEFLFYEY